MASPEDLGQRQGEDPISQAQSAGADVHSLDQNQGKQSSSAPIEMNPLPPEGKEEPAVKQTEEVMQGQIAKNTASGPPQDSESTTSATAPDVAATGSASPPPLKRQQTAPAIGPATDKPTPLTREATTEGPVLYITLLLASTGARHPFRLDAKYLRKRGVEVEGNNPINISLYKLKELILRDWREEWNAKPSSPESIRLITMGKLLNDKARLADSGFTNGLTPHIVHMTVKPQDIVDEEEANKAAGKDRDGNERSPGCRCIIQ